MSRRGVCSVCSHPQASQIDAQLVTAGVRQSEVSRSYGPSEMSVSRHKRKCLPKRLQAANKSAREAAKEYQTRPADDILARLATLHAETREILAECRKSKDLDTALKAIARLERQMELEGRLLGIGELAPAGSTTVNLLTLDRETSLRIARAVIERHGRAQLPAAPLEVEVVDPDRAGEVAA